MYLPLHAHLLEPTDDGIGDAFSYGLTVFAGLFYILLNFWGYWNNLKKFKKTQEQQNPFLELRVKLEANHSVQLVNSVVNLPSANRHEFFFSLEVICPHELS